MTLNLTANLTLNLRDADVLRHHQKWSGAFLACERFSQYRFCWLRDSSFMAYSLDLADLRTHSRAFHLWVAQTLAPLKEHFETLLQRKNAGEQIPYTDMLPTRFGENGEWEQDGWPNFQLDGYGQWLWALSEHLRLSGETDLPEVYRDSVQMVVSYLQHFWEMGCSDCWEEFHDHVHTATLASIYGGLNSISRFPSVAVNPEVPAQIKARILTEHVKNGRLVKSNHLDGVDASLLWVSTPFKVLDENDPIMQATVQEIENTLVRDGGVIRYDGDSYYGAGAWLLLTDWLGWYFAEAGDPEKAQKFFQWSENQRTREGHLPEQVAVSSTDPAKLQEWNDLWGSSANPLLWSHAMHAVLLNRLKI
ncbi:glycoside hydrolase family 15 protein [Deinococcus roseus]|uniref:GH15-like domain-containing protein n=1 Tax=Deinococcus roseus TaxID=392414 RepID=A0ABQ2D662_9DEIO|nr:glycoside hydrolase family 15 protein [Deinococcus roseus]GGJ47315.1 hypothetical protein GCM10008938_36710 [Deinococcus roseus]